MKKYIPYLQILAAAVCWGCIGLFSRALLNAGFGPANIVVLRNMGGLIVLFAVFALRDREVFHVERRDLPAFFGTGVVSVLLFTLCYFRCQQLCSLAVSAILLYTAPAMVVIMSAIAFHEKITKRKISALVLALLGCSFVTGIWSGEANITFMGILFGLGSAFFYALYSIFGRVALRRNRSIKVVFWTFVFAGIGSLFVVDMPAMTAGFADTRMIFVAVGLILISTVAPYLLYTKGLESVESGTASIMASLEPVVASLVGICVYGEPFSLAVLLGLGCILACVYILR